jgi:alpha-L-rhamnosidase
MKQKVLLLLAILFFAITGSAQVTLTSLLCENRPNPIGLDVSQPRFTWQLVAVNRNVLQTAYELKVNSGKETIWNSGKVASSQSVQVSYAGPALQTGRKYSWQVRVWDNSGKISEWSSPAYFKMAFLNPSDWKATWIQPGYIEISGAVRFSEKNLR